MRLGADGELRHDADLLQHVIALDGMGLDGLELLVRQLAGLVEHLRRHADLSDVVQQSDTVILLDERGKQYTSVEFSEIIKKWTASGTKRIVFIIGGPYGFAQEVYDRADAQMSLSPMTFSHQMVRLVLVEQLYRAFTILKNEPYHHN